MKRNKAAHFSAGVIFRPDPDTNEDQVLVLEYADLSRPDKPLQIKLPGGNAENGETPLETLEREVSGEIGCLVRSSSSFLLHEEVVNENHVRCFFLVFLPVQAVLREEAICDDGDEHLGPPRWVSVEWALENLFPSHRQGLREVVEKLQARLALP